MHSTVGASAVGRVVALAVVGVLFAGLLASGFGSAFAGVERSQDDGPDPTVQLRFDRQNITPANATDFVLYVGNPSRNDRPIHVLVLVKAHLTEGNIDVLLDERSGIEVGDSIVWRFNHDLSPGNYRLSYGTVHRNADPGNYPVEVTVRYSKGDGIVSRNVTEMLTVKPLSNLADGDDEEGPLAWIAERVEVVLAFITGNPQTVAAVVAILTLVISVVESNRIWAALVRLGRWTKSILARITRWAFGDERR